MAHALFARCVVSLVVLVDHSCNVGVLGIVRGGGAECGLVKYNRYIPKDGHLVAINFLWEGWVRIM